MPTFSKTKIDSPDIDPDALTVHLLGPEPDADDLVKAPENVEMPVNDNDIVSEPIPEPIPEPISEPISETISEASPVTKETQPIESVDSVSEEADTRDEDEIRAIEEMLRSKKSVRAKLQQAKKEENAAKPKKQAKKIDPIVIAAAVVAAALLVVFIAYFAGFFNKNASLGMTIDEFSTKYSKTESMELLGQMGFAFPVVEYIDPTSMDASVKTDDDISYFSASVDNTYDTSVWISGETYKSDNQVKRMSVIILGSADLSMDIVNLICAPYLQTLYPQMTTKEVGEYLTASYAKADPLTIKGSYGFALRQLSSNGTSYYVLDLISAKNADAYRKEYVAG